MYPLHHARARCCSGKPNLQQSGNTVFDSQQGRTCQAHHIFHTSEVGNLVAAFTSLGVKSPVWPVGHGVGSVGLQLLLAKTTITTLNTKTITVHQDSLSIQFSYIQFTGSYSFFNCINIIYERNSLAPHAQMHQPLPLPRHVCDLSGQVAVRDVAAGTQHTPASNLQQHQSK